MPYEVRYAPEAEQHFLDLTARDRAIVRSAVLTQLVHHPSQATRNRKPMRPNPLPAWELRVGRLRIYDDVHDAPDRIVTILAIGIKEHNRVRIVRIGGEEYEL